MELPYSNKAEMALIGSIINDPTIISDLKIIEEDFYNEINTQAFKICQQLGIKTNIITLHDAMNNMCDLTFLNECTNLAYSTMNFNHFEEIIIKKSVLRKQIILAQEIMSNSYSGNDSTDLFKTATDFNNHDDGELVLLKDLVNDEVENIEAYNDGKVEPGIMTRMKGLDYYANGLVNGDLIYLGARPSMGKSAFAMQIALNIAAQGKKVAVFSLEMQNAKLVRRMLVNQSRVHLNTIKEKRLDDSSKVKLQNAASKLFNQNIALSDKAGQTAMDILRKAKRHQKINGLDVLIIDHFHLLKSSINGTNYERRSFDSQLLKETAKELNVPVICLCQLSRALEQRVVSDRMPILSDLKETGSLEQDGDLIVFINRQDYWFKNDSDYVKTNDADISVAKNRDGETGNFKMMWTGGTQRFDNI